MSNLHTDVTAGPMLGLSPATLRNMRVKGDGPPFVKMGRAVRYREEDLRDWVAARVVGSTSQRVPA
ncbi:helix-turn-helix transcriptional regulator [Sphingomonas sp. 179-I 2A4 NHS]|uniref:helix-turn-helix transcriptional regulator n=2 Tax=unclassified Sphingomonas TaxID=196159 RepID=UPI003879776B